MGCNNSAPLQAEIVTLRKDIASLTVALRQERDQKDSLHKEMTKATEAVMSLSQENQKLTFLLHARKNSEVPLETKVFESTKEEFNKMKEWSELEIENGNTVLSTLLESSTLTAKDETHKEITSLQTRIKASIYDPDQLIELCKLRAEFIDDLLQDCIEYRKETNSLIKTLETTVIAGLRVVRGDESNQFVKALQEATGTEKLRVVRSALKTFGFNGGYEAIRDIDREKELGDEVHSLTVKMKAAEAKIKTLEETVEELEEAHGDEMVSPEESEATPAPVEEQKPFQRRLSRRPTFVEGNNPLIGELSRANEKIKVYEEQLHDVQTSAKVAREKGTKEAILKLMIGLETMAAAVKDPSGGYGGRY